MKDGSQTYELGLHQPPQPHGQDLPHKFLAASLQAIKSSLAAESLEMMDRNSRSYCKTA